MRCDDDRSVAGEEFETSPEKLPLVLLCEDAVETRRK